MARFGSALLALIGLTVGTPAWAEMITFGNVSNDGSPIPISNGYAGLNWSNFYLVNAVDLLSDIGPTGYSNGIVASPNVVYDGFGTIAETSASAPFTFNSGYFTGAWCNDLNITVIGLLNGASLDTTTFTVNSTSPTLETFNWSGINEVEFVPLGGVRGNYSGSGTEFVMDDVTVNASYTSTAIVPSPSSLACMLGVGAVWLAAAGCRKWKGRLAPTT